MKGIIFDFNGTLFYDTHFHDLAWEEMILELTGRKPSRDEMLHYVLGKDNPTILKYFLDGDISEEEIDKYSYEKEFLYREICKKNPDQVKLLDGAESLLDELTEKNIPINIATSAPKENVDFYFDVFNLSRWFLYDCIIYHDGSFRPKPHGDIYRIASKKLGFEPKDLIGIEDSNTGLESRMRAGIGLIIAVDPKDDHPNFHELEYVDRVIKDFREIEVGDFEWEID